MRGGSHDRAAAERCASGRLNALHAEDNPIEIDA
jgi:hypothetical protein